MTNIVDVYLEEISKLQEQIVRLQSENIKLTHKLKLEEERVYEINKYASKLYEQYKKLKND